MALIVCDVLRVRLRCKRCISRWAHCCPTYGHFTLFVCALCGCQPLLNRRKDRRDLRCGLGLVRDRHYEAWSSRLALVGNSSAGNGCASINPARIPPSAPSISAFSSIPISIFWSSLLYLLAVSQKPHTSLKLGWSRSSHTVWSMAVLLPSFFYAIMLLVITIARITVVYSSIVKLLLTTSTPPQSQCTYTQQDNGKFSVYHLFLMLPLCLLEKGMRWPFQASPNNTKETRREKTKKKKKRFN